MEKAGGLIGCGYQTLSCHEILRGSQTLGRERAALEGNPSAVAGLPRVSNSRRGKATRGCLIEVVALSARGPDRQVRIGFPKVKVEVFQGFR